MAMGKEGQTPIDVCWADQKKICTFGRMHRRFEKVAELIKSRKEDLERVSDALDEICIADDVKYVYGEAFIALDNDEVEGKIEVRQGELEQELKKLEAEHADLDSKMKTLKATLYAKFGDQIYLERE